MKKKLHFVFIYPMKSILFIMIFIFSTRTIAQKPTFVSPSEYLNKTNFNTFYDKPFDPLYFKATHNQIKSILNIMQIFKGYENYPSGLCETRSHYISLLADTLNIKTFKVWLLCSSLTNTLFSKGLSLKSAPELTWDYHVATAVFNEAGEILIFDPVIDINKPIQIEVWLSSFNAPNSIYFYTLPGYFQYYTQSLLTMPNYPLFNGQFWKLTPNTNNEPIPSDLNNMSNWIDYLAIRLAANNLASLNTKKKNTSFYTLINNYANYKTWYTNNNDDTFVEERQILNKFKAQFQEAIKNIKANTCFFYMP